MAHQPSFIGFYRQEITLIKGRHYNEPRLIFTPGAKGSRIHGISIYSTHPHEVVVDFGEAKIRSPEECHFFSSDPSQGRAACIVRKGSFPFPSGEWAAGESVTVSRGLQHPENRGDFKIAEVKRALLVLDASHEVKTEKIFGPLMHWSPWWSLKVPQEAGVKGNPCASGLDPQHLPWLDPEDPHLLLTSPLWARLPHTTQENTGDLTIHLCGGDY